MLEFLYSIDNSPYQLWQGDLLDWSIRRNHPGCRITRLSGLAPDRDTYACLNRFWSLVHEWRPSDAQTVIILDPDMVLVKPLNVEGRKGALLGQPYGYVWGFPWCPLVLHRDNVRDWAVKALPLARAIHWAGGGWISEMWAGSIAANMLGLNIHRSSLAVFNCESNLNQASVIHYCYEHAGFHKRHYRPGHTVHMTQETEVQQQLRNLLHQCFPPGCEYRPTCAPSDATEDATQHCQEDRYSNDVVVSPDTRPELPSTNEEKSHNHWTGADISRILEMFRPLAARQSQLSADQIERIAAYILAKAPLNLLVFGLGDDAAFWNLCNKGGRTVFLEDDASWIDRSKNSLASAQICRIRYTTRLDRWEENLSFPTGWPASQQNIPWDLILIDGPKGYKAGLPGRQQSIWCASQLRLPQTCVFLHDHDRPWERRCADAYLGAPQQILPGPHGSLAEWFATDSAK